MATKRKSQSALFGDLVRRQRKHKRLLEKVEKSSARLERRKAKLQAMEGKIADLEHRLSEPRKGRLGKMSPRDGELKRARLIFNPGSGRDDEDNAARLSKLVASLRAHGIEARVGLKTSGSAARKLAREAVKAGEKLVLVAGGDGTLGDVAAELAGSSTVLGIIPTGTMNNVARSLGVPLEINDACALIGMGTTRHIDLGRVVSSRDTKAEYFLECAGVGVSAIAAMGGQAFLKKHWSIVPKALRKFFEAKPAPMKVEMDGTVIDASTQIITISNAPLMGNQMLAVPGAKMDDGLLDVQIYDGMGDAELVKHFKAAASGSPNEIKTYQVRHVRITSDEPVLTNSDMNIAKEQKMIEMEVVAGALSVIVGNGIGLSVPVESAPDAPTFAEDPPVTTAEEAKAPAEPVLEDA
jgi:diacylglycerol kinase (ATP)